MKASELRIGNWVNTMEGNYQVVDVLCDSINTMRHNSLPYELVQPITLTPEILEKYGLIRGKFHENRNVYYSTGTQNLKFSILGTNGQILLYSGHKSYSVPFFCEHLHQLQNLYYALTGEELNYQP